MQGARGVLINITGGSDLTLFELDEAANRIREEVDPEANIIVGSTMDPSLEAIMRVSVVATGIDAIEGAADIPVPRRSLKEPLPAGTELTAPVEEAAPAPVAEPVAAATPEAEPVAEVEAVAETVAEPSLFEAMTVETPAEPAPVAAELTTDDGLPAPAYQPQPAAVETVEATESFFDRQTEYAAAPAQAEVGQPSASTLARLDAAVSKAPRVEETRAETPKFFAGSAQAEKPKGFRLNSLISRMTGHGDTQETAHREQPPVSQSADMAEDQVDPEQERIEIPAFLRRQAN